MRHALNWDKFKALVHYICEKADDPSVLGSVKLNKVLWYSDVVHFMVHGSPITGETYIKRQRGPVPRNILKALKELESEQKIRRGKVDFFGYEKNEYIALEPANKAKFTGEEVDIVDGAFRHVCHNHTARSVSEETHDVIWELAELGEEMPYETVFAGYVGEVDESDFEWANGELDSAVA